MRSKERDPFSPERVRIMMQDEILATKFDMNSIEI